ncbi:hypothetical protein [Methylobacter sp.]|uniref:hypothetical protein n=1 Tax=Methylobacter sp. TaxID=2051955 RepID=UPI002FDCC327
MAIATSTKLDKTSDQFLLDSYSGLGGYASGAYLVPHGREEEDDFEARKNLAVYRNFARKIVDVYMGFLWKQPPNREVDDLYTQFMANADGAGGKLDSVLSSHQRLAMILGTVYVIVDKPQQQGQSRADQAIPYLALRMKNQLVAETKNAAGVWQSVTFVEQEGNEKVYRTFTTTGWRLTKDQEGSEVITRTLPDGSTKAEQGDYKIGRVPVVRLHIAKPLNPTDSYSQSFFYDLAQLCWELYNIGSELREQEREQAFSILTIPAADKEERERLQNLTIGTKNGLTYNPTGGGQPGYIAPLPDPMAHCMQRMAAIVLDIYRVANLEFVGSVQPSGEALSFHFMEANCSLSGMAEMCESAETEIAQLVSLWQGGKFTGNISYPTDFNLSDVIKAIGIAMDSINLGMGAEFDKAVKKLLAKQVLRNDVSSTTMAAIEKEIDAMGDTYGDRLARQQAGA